MRKPEIWWSDEKNQLLKDQRKLTFEAVATAIEDKQVLDDFAHPTRRNQRILVVELEGYICSVPYVMDGDGMFLKTIYPNRELQKKYKVPNEN